MSYAVVIALILGIFGVGYSCWLIYCLFTTKNGHNENNGARGIFLNNGSDNEKATVLLLIELLIFVSASVFLLFIALK